MNACALQGFKLADVELNRAWRQVQPTISRKEKTQLIAAQRLWLSFRDLHCDFAASLVPSPAAKEQTYQQCRRELTEERTGRLRSYTDAPGEIGAIDVGTADKALNATYRQLLSEQQGIPRERLVKAERAWIRYRDALCSFEQTRWAPDSLSADYYERCQQELTEERTRTLTTLSQADR
jgi:uncharacterized protein YecT (DUF1311 family)